MKERNSLTREMAELYRHADRKGEKKAMTQEKSESENSTGSGCPLPAAYDNSHPPQM